MEWTWDIYKEYVTKQLQRKGMENPSEEILQTTFIKLLSESTITVLVQEPWQNSVRFKGLAKYPVKDVMELIMDPMNFLLDKFGGGKFKLNFHHGWNFVGTRNFKPTGTSRWQDLPEINF